MPEGHGLQLHVRNQDLLQKLQLFLNHNQMQLLQLYLLLDTIYAGYMQVTLQSARTVTIAMRLANIGKDFALLHRQYVYMLLFYVLYRWDIKQVMMEVDAKEQQLQENLVQRVYAFVAPKLVAGANAKSPVEGAGISSMKDALQLQDIEISSFGRDICITGRMGKEISCLPEL